MTARMASPRKVSRWEVFNAADQRRKKRKAKAKRIGTKPTKKAIAAGLKKAIKALTIDLHRAVRANDGPVCISCGKSPLGAAEWNAGHLFAVGPYPGLRFHPANIASQCVGCNKYKRGNHAAYAAAFIRRHGAEYLQTLDDIKREPMQWRAEELVQLREALRSAGFAAYVNLYFDLERVRLERKTAA